MPNCYNKLRTTAANEKVKPVTTDFQKSHVPNAANLNNAWYHNSCQKLNLREKAPSVNAAYDALIIGAGFTGVSAALKLAKSGASVAIIEQHALGNGASGRNGGLVCSGFRHDQKWFEDKIGALAAQDVWQVAEAAKAHLRANLHEHKIEADFETGLVFAAHSKSTLDWAQKDAEHLTKQYGYSALTNLDNTECANALGTDVYWGGVRDDGAGRIHPLKYLFGLLQAVDNAGAHIFEKCQAQKVVETSTGIEITTNMGVIKAKKLLLCGDGQLEGINSQVEAKVMPIGSFMIATKPIEDEFMRGAVGAMDTKFVVNYFQRTRDNRLLFGGGEKYTPHWPKDIASFVRKNLTKIYPQFAEIEITHAWGGILGITPTRLPFVRQISNNILVSAGYSGQGVLLAPFFGDILAKVILSEKSPFAMIDKLPVPDFPGGKFMRFPLLTAALSYYSILDKLP